jgi:hypothetical protein
MGRSASGMTRFKNSVVGRSKKAFKSTAHNGRRAAVRKGPRNPGLIGLADLPLSKLESCPHRPAGVSTDASATDNGKLRRTVSWDISGASGDADKDELAPEKLPV